MIKMDVFLLDNNKNTKEEKNIIKPKSYQDLLSQLRIDFKNLPELYEIFIVDKNNTEIKINNEEKYTKIEDILFIREINLEESLFTKNYKDLSESNQEILDEKYFVCYVRLLLKKKNHFFVIVVRKYSMKNV